MLIDRKVIEMLDQAFNLNDPALYRTNGQSESYQLGYLKGIAEVIMYIKNMGEGYVSQES